MIERDPFAHVFVATDFSLSAACAVARAGSLPLAPGAEITVVHVLSDDTPQKILMAAEKLARRQLSEATKTIREALRALGRRRVTVSSAIHRGQGYVEIVRQARAVGADLVVLGRHGLRPVRDMFIGSTAERVIRAGDLPVLVVSRRSSRPYQRPLVAVDLEDTSRSVIATAMRALGPEAASVTMVHAYHVPFEGFMNPGVPASAMTDLRKEYRAVAVSGLAKVQASLGDRGVDWKTVVVRGDPRSVVVAEAARARADLLVLGTHGRTGLAHALIGSVAERIIQAVACDVLVARPARVSFELP